MIREFNLLETCNAHIQLLEKEDEFKKNKLRLSLDVQLPNRLVGDEKGLCNSITQIATFLAQYLANGIDIEIQKAGQHKRSISLITKVKGTCSHQTMREAFQVISKNMSWLDKMPYKTSFWILSDYLQFSFKITFQRVDEERAHIANSFLNSKILLAEGNKMNARVLSSYLEEWGCYVTQVNTGEEAMAVASVSKFDLIILDIYMFEMQERTVIQDMRSLNPKTPIILLVPFPLEHATNELLFSNANDLLFKPANKTQLFSILAKHL
ncbi:MAG TPA: response regulator [Cyclobacteriaceae bacterium]